MAEALLPNKRRSKPAAKDWSAAQFSCCSLMRESKECQSEPLAHLYECHTSHARNLNRPQQSGNHRKRWNFQYRQVAFRSPQTSGGEQRELVAEVESRFVLLCHQIIVSASNLVSFFDSSLKSSLFGLLFGVVAQRSRAPDS